MSRDIVVDCDGHVIEPHSLAMTVWGGVSREKECRLVNEIAASAGPPRNDYGGVDPFYPSNQK